MELKKHLSNCIGFLFLGIIGVLTLVGGIVFAVISVLWSFADRIMMWLEK